MIRSMLYATDLGVYAPFVMQHAVALARSFNAQLYVIHAVEPMGLIAESVLQSYLDESTLDRLHNHGLSAVMAGIETKVLQSLRSDLGDDEPALALIRAVRVLQGDPAEVILDQAQRLKVDLLVLGSHSQVATVDVSLGRTATRVLQLSPAPVYLVPLTEQRSRLKS